MTLSSYVIHASRFLYSENIQEKKKIKKKKNEPNDKTIVKLKIVKNVYHRH